jgi:lipopolysaccharide transport system ATP-binding protein
MGAIVVEGLGKAYKHYARRLDRLVEWLWPFSGVRHELKWILRDVSFRVEPGRALGIIGVNGAGKSTLLKMITGTTQPTTGSVQLTGRVAALLELGLGFHPDFTGRQNAIMAAQLLGILPADIERLMPSIEAFAELGEYIDEPVRVYSSGMQVRLAFSVATAVRPDVLIVDEALSVGDAYFQHKSFARIREFREKGTTLLIVSHDKNAIQAVCDEAIVLHQGRLAMQGAPEAAMDFYNALIAEREESRVSQQQGIDGKTATVSGTGEAVVADIALHDASGKRLEVVEVGADVTLRIRVSVRAPIARLVLGYRIKDRLGQPIFGTNTHHKNLEMENVRPGDELVYDIRFPMNLGIGNYSIATALHSTDTHLVNNYEWRDLAYVFQVINAHRDYFEGCAWIVPRIEVRRA